MACSIKVVPLGKSKKTKRYNLCDDAEHTCKAVVECSQRFDFATKTFYNSLLCLKNEELYEVHQIKINTQILVHLFG